MSYIALAKSARIDPQVGHIVVPLSPPCILGILEHRDDRACWAWVKHEPDGKPQRYRVGLIRVATLAEIAASEWRGAACRQADDAETGK